MKRESRKIGDRFKKTTLTLNSKNVAIRAIIAGVCLLLAILLFLNSCSKYLNQSKYLTINYPIIENEDEENITLFNNEVNIQYYYDKDNENKSTSEVYNKITSILNECIELYKLCDDSNIYIENEYPIHNLKYVNDNPNTWISVDTRLFNLLKEAKELNEGTNGLYSIFSGKLYDKWDEIFLYYNVDGSNQSSIEKNDPYYNENIRTSINSIVESINSNTTDIEFDEENKKVKFNVATLDKENIKLDLGLLESSYYLDFLKSKFIENKLTSGYITNKDGMVVTLGQNLTSPYYTFKSYSFQTMFNINNSLILDYSFSFNGALSYMTFNPMQEVKCGSISQNTSYYFFEKNNIYYRSMILNSLTGDSFSKNYSTFTFSTNKSLSQQLEDNYNLYFNDSNYAYDYLLNYENDDKYGLILSFNNGNTNIANDGITTLLMSKLVDRYNDEKYIPFIKTSSVVKTKIVATKEE